MTPTPEQEAWAERARSRDVLDVAKALGIPVKRSDHGVPCPLCGGTDRFSVTRKKQIAHCRHCGTRDVVALVMEVKRYTFPEACEWLTGEPDPKGKPSEKVAETGNRPAKLAPAKSRATLEREGEEHRQKEIGKANGIWEAGEDAAGTLVEFYYAARGLTLSPAWPVRYSAEQPYWHQGEVIWRGPAKLAAITSLDAHPSAALLERDNPAAGYVVGCHITWLDPDDIGRKATIIDPDEQGRALPAKKIRGSKRKGAIRLVSPKGFTRLVIGEGIETTGSVYEAERAGFIAARTAYWAGIDLGHIGGKAAAAIAHPTLVTDKGNPCRVPGPLPEPQPDRDLDIPDQVQEVVLLGDGDSDPFTTEMALRRAAARFSARPTTSLHEGDAPRSASRLEKPGRVIRIAWAPPGGDFNDVLLGRATA